MKLIEYKSNADVVHLPMSVGFYGSVQNMLIWLLDQHTKEEIVEANNLIVKGMPHKGDTPWPPWVAHYMTLWQLVKAFENEAVKAGITQEREVADI